MRWPGNRWPSLVRDEPRAALAAVLETPEGVLTVVATHLTVIPGWTTRQLRHLTAQVASLPRPLVLLGDLNLDDDRPGPHDGHATRSRRPRRTPSAPPTRQLDHVLADGRVRALGPGRAVDTGLSDHRALVVDVSLD